MTTTVEPIYEAQPDKRWKQVVSKISFLVTATEGEKKLGVCSVVNFHGFSRITTLYVIPEARTRGIGTRLICFACENVAAKENDVYVEADCFEPSSIEKASNGQYHPPMNDSELRKFYLNLGFTPVDGHPFSLVLRREKYET